MGLFGRSRQSERLDVALSDADVARLDRAWAETRSPEVADALSTFLSLPAMRQTLGMINARHPDVAESHIKERARLDWDVLSLEEQKEMMRLATTRRRMIAIGAVSEERANVLGSVGTDDERMARLTAIYDALDATKQAETRDHMQAKVNEGTPEERREIDKPLGDYLTHIGVVWQS